MAFEIQGTHVSYTFNNTFDLADYNRSNDIPLTVAFGRDGAIAETRRQRRNATTHLMSGVIQEASVASSLAELDRLQVSCLSMNDGAILIDTTNDRRVNVQLTRVNASREPARQIHVSVEFQIIGEPFWEEKELTKITFGTLQWFNLKLGDAPNYARQVIHGFVNNPTLVQGNWNFCTHMGYTTASAINTNAGVSPFGTVQAALSTVGTQTPTRYGFGRIVSAANSMVYSGLSCRTDRFSFMVRFAAASIWDAAGDKYLFDFGDQHASLGTHHLYLQIKGDASNAVYEFGSQGNTVVAPVTTYTAGKELQISGWLTTDGTTLASGTTMKFKMFENDIEIVSRATFTAPAIATVTKLFIGSDTSGALHGLQIIDEVYIWHQSLSDDFFKSTAREQKVLIPDNKTFKWAAALSTTDFLEIDHSESRVLYHDISAANISSRLRPFAGEFFRLGTGSGRSNANEDTVYSSVAIISEFEYRKKYL